eukprot:Sspe_Gene.88569::Locus_60551_Transcript_1_1_Confidence_1.000_Length_487::g.88569::m.88569
MGGGKASDVLFVVNFDKDRTTEADLRDFFRGFDVYEIDMWRGGKGVKSKNYCFVTMKSVDAAIEAKEALNGKYIGDRQVTVEYKCGDGRGRGGGGGGRYGGSRRRSRSYSSDRGRRRRRSDSYSDRRRRRRSDSYSDRPARRRTPDYSSYRD